jgi:hypothetical protein
MNYFVTSLANQALFISSIYLMMKVTSFEDLKALYGIMYSTVDPLVYIWSDGD